MKIKMLKTIPGSPDGIKVNLYKKDEVYDNVPDSLAKVFIQEKYAEHASIMTKPTVESKAQVSSPENKMEDEKKKDKK